MSTDADLDTLLRALSLAEHACAVYSYTDGLHVYERDVYRTRLQAVANARAAIRTRVAALASQPAPEQPAAQGDVAAQLEAWANDGLCPALVFDDDGRWAVTFDGMSPSPPDGGFTETVGITAVVDPEQWRDSVIAAIDSARAE